MALFESLWKKESLDKRQVEAFATLADALVFNTPRNFKLSRISIPEFSRMVQEEFLAQDAAHKEEQERYIQKNMHEAVLDSLRRMAEDAGISEPHGFIEETTVSQNEKSLEEKDAQEKTKTDIFLGATKKYLSSIAVDDSFQYGAWGFTPKLAGRKQEGSFSFAKKGKNCFGVAQGLAAIYKNLGLPFKMGITADHPFLVVDVEGKKYLTSLFGAQEARGYFEAKEGYTIYTPAVEDDIPYKMMLLWDFDEALVYEQLENFEVLRQLSLGADVYTIPDTRESGIEIAEQYTDALQATSWRDIQAKVTPELSHYFRVNRDTWAAEVERIALKHEIRHFLKETMGQAKEVTSLRELPFDDFKKQFLPIAKKYKKAIVDFVECNTPFPPDTPEDVVHFSEYIQSRLTAISENPEDALRKGAAELILKPFLEEGHLTDE